MADEPTGDDRTPAEKIADEIIELVRAKQVGGHTGDLSDLIMLGAYRYGFRRFVAIRKLAGDKQGAEAMILMRSLRGRGRLRGAARDRVTHVLARCWDGCWDRRAETPRVQEARSPPGPSRPKRRCRIRMAERDGVYTHVLMDEAEVDYAMLLASNARGPAPIAAANQSKV
jgi:hypothetical protein